MILVAGLGRFEADDGLMEYCGAVCGVKQVGHLYDVRSYSLRLLRRLQA